MLVFYAFIYRPIELKLCICEAEGPEPYTCKAESQAPNAMRIKAQALAIV